MCINCKTKPLKFNQQIYSFGQKLIAVFTKCYTDFEPVPTLKFIAAQIKAISSFYDHCSRDLKHLPLTKLCRKSPQKQ